MRRLVLGLVVAALAAALMVPGSSLAQPEEIWVVTEGNVLRNFMSNSPGVCASRAITGLGAGERVVGIDFRPRPPAMRLYALTQVGQLYLISNPATGVATPVGSPVALSGSFFGFDFNPVVDRIRVISDADQNLRLHPDTGTLVSADLALNYAGPDPNAGANPVVDAGAYTNNTQAPATTVLYDIDTALDILLTQNPPNNGTLNTVGSLGFDVQGQNGFDISGLTGIAYAALQKAGDTAWTLFTIDVATGQATGLGLICQGERLEGLSVANDDVIAVEPATWGRIKQQFKQ